jgi:hypothetical protein
MRCADLTYQASAAVADRNPLHLGWSPAVCDVVLCHELHNKQSNHKLKAWHQASSEHKITEPEKVHRITNISSQQKSLFLVSNF